MSHPGYPDLPDLPELAAVRRFEQARAEVATTCERISQLPQPDPEELRIDPGGDAERAERLRAAVESGAAPPELVRLGRAVRAGKTTYAAIASGAADDLPVVAEARAGMQDRIRQAMTDGVVPDNVETPASQRNDSPSESFMRPSW